LTASLDVGHLTGGDDGHSSIVANRGEFSVVEKRDSNQNSEVLIQIAPSAYQDIKQSLRRLYVEDDRPWLVGFSGGKDSTMLASLVFDAVLSIPAEERKKPVAILCTDTRVEIPAIVEKEKTIYGVAA
jgi:3'-phosphoadenosine 5'-phosphosulfate sulfotransferase (PAPS reductase)/FAD synthetase